MVMTDPDVAVTPTCNGAALFPGTTGRPDRIGIRA